MANSLKDMVQSVDWSKVLSGKDTRNALIGSALGGLVMGGTGLMAERDPEESKAAPIRDALMGMLLGGVAGYGIPKGISLFLDSGGLAPDDDVLRHSYGRHALAGAGIGTGAAGLAIWRTLHNVAQGMRPTDEKRRAAFRDMEAAFRRNPTEDARRAMYAHDLDATRAHTFLENMREQRDIAARSGNHMRAAAWDTAISDFKKARSKAVIGYSGFTDLLDQVGRQGTAERSSLLSRMLFASKPGSAKPDAGAFKRFASGAGNAVKDFVAGTHNYHGGRQYFGKGPRLSIAGNAGLRMLRRAGRWGGYGALAAMLLHKALGPSASDNYKK